MFSDRMHITQLFSRVPMYITIYVSYITKYPTYLSYAKYPILQNYFYLKIHIMDVQVFHLFQPCIQYVHLCLNGMVIYKRSGI